MKGKINTKKTLFVFFILFVVIIAIDVIFLQDTYFEGKYFKMDTDITIRGDGENMDLATRDILNAIDKIDAEMNANSTTSLVYKLNNNSDQVEFSEEFIKLLRLCEDIKLQSGGAFNVAIRPLVEVWGFGGHYPELPETNEILNSAKEVNSAEITINGNKVSSTGMLDFGGVAKGYAGDVAKEILKKHNVNYAILDFGGNIVTYGKKPDGTPFTVGISDGANGVFATLEVSECNIITSGNYQRYFEQDGKKYHHILDPKTGYPAESGLISVTIISDNGALGDALSTACYILGIEKGMKLAHHYNVEAVFLSDNKTVFTTDNVKLTLKSDDYMLAK